MAQAAIQLKENFSDPLWRLNNLYWCVDEKGNKTPFECNETQAKLIGDLWFFNLILKSRQHGITTLVAILALDHVLFRDNFKAGICAHTREDVEKIFKNKVKFPYDNLPAGIRNARPANTDTAKMLSFENGSSIEVATSLRSGTFQFVHISEFGKICAKYPEKAREIVTGTFETVHPGSYLFVESTAEGREGHFYRYVMDAVKRQQMSVKPNKLQFKLHFFAWWQDRRNRLDVTRPIPDDLAKYFDGLERALKIRIDERQRAWYATKSETLEEDMKREHPSTVDEAFEAAISGAYLAKQMEHLRTNNRIGEVPHDPSLPVNTAWDFGLNDRMCIWLHQQKGMQHRLIGYESGTDDDVLYYWRELQKKPYSWGVHFLPHDAGTRRIGSARTADEAPRSIEKILKDAGMRNIRIVPKVDDKWTAIQESRLFLPLCWIDQKCTQGIDALDNFRREWDETAGEWKNRPHHNWAMHPYDALETLARGVSKFGTGNDAPRPRDIMPEPEEDY